jgi:hypothetical protein
LAIRREIKASETKVVQEIGKLFTKATNISNLISKSFEENSNNREVIENIQNLSEQVKRAMINYDAEFKILITNQKIQIAAETSDITNHSKH